jgi:hypothetical protein
MHALPLTPDPAPGGALSGTPTQTRSGRRLQRRPGLGALTVAVLLGTSLQAWATQAGTQVRGTADLLEFACTTCPFGPGELLSDESAGSLNDGPAQATVDQAHLHRYGPVVGAAYAGQATIVGPDALPLLGVSARSTFRIPDAPFGGYEPRLWALHPDWPYDFQFNPALRYSAFVEAAAVQQYTIAPLGTDATSFTLGVNFSGVIGGGANHWAAANVRVYANDYDPDNPSSPGRDGGDSLIGQGSAFIDGAMLGAQTLPQAFAAQFDVSFDLFDGDTSLFVVVDLIGRSGTAFENTGGFVDATDGLQLSFTAGDTTLLTPVLAPVPEPGAAWLLAAGLVGLGGWRLRQGRTS